MLARILNGLRPFNIHKPASSCNAYTCGLLHAFVNRETFVKLLRLRGTFLRASQPASSASPGLYCRAEMSKYTARLIVGHASQTAKIISEKTDPSRLVGRHHPCALQAPPRSRLQPSDLEGNRKTDHSSLLVGRQEGLSANGLKGAD